MSDTRRKRYPGALKARNENGDVGQRSQSGQQSHNYRRNKNNNAGNYRDGVSRMNSMDKVKRIVQEEGRTARNLVLYHVPVQDQQHYQNDRSRQRQTRKSLSQKEQADQKTIPTKSLSDLTKSPKTDAAKKPDLRARYWKFLFDNLQRAVDAIYETCEQDESALECREVIMMLEQSTKDFKSLIDRLHVQKEFELAFKDGDRPVSIAWEVRKMSPGKSPSGFNHHTSPSPAQRVLNFSFPQDQKSTKPSIQSPGNSWADKVKGISSSPPVTMVTGSPTDRELCPVLPEPPVLSPVPSSQTESGDSYKEVNESEESDGWETVQKGGRIKPYGSPSQRSLENLSTVANNDKHRLTRSVSDPNASIQKYKKKTPNSSKRDTKKNQAVKAKVDTTESVLPSSQPRPRTDSKDSEKENRPGSSSIGSSTEQISESPAESVISTTAPVVTKSNKSPVVSKKVVNSKPSGSSRNSVGKVKDSKVNKTKGATVKGSGKTGSDSIVKEDVINENGLDLRASDVEDLKLSSDPDDDDSSYKQLNAALASVMDEENQLTDQLEKEQDKALQSAIQEEETWLKELAKEENTVIDVETENESDLGNTMSSLDTSTPGTLDWDTMVAEYDAAEESGDKKSWEEMVEEADTRTPGHAVHMHEKLSSPSRKRSPTESKKRHEEKQAKAQELRDKLMLEKAVRLKDLGKKVEEVRAWKEELMARKREMMERKMQQAEEKRQTMLKSKAQKAHDEEAKANEIAFINSLEAQNKRLDIISKHQESEARLQDIQDERQRKHEEKLAKEAAVEERRKILQAERLARLQEIQERRKMKDLRREKKIAEKETERQEALRAKEKDREDRLEALNAQHEQRIQELQRKIQQKQDESSQRHMEALKQIREKAFEMSVLRHSTEDHNDAPKLTPYDNKKICTICNVLIPSEVYLLSHLRGKTHQQALKHNNNGMSMSKQEIETFNLKHIVNAPDNNTHPKIVSEKERIKSLKKRCKKLKQRMNTRGLEYENGFLGKQPVLESENKAKMQKVIRDVNKYLQTQESGPWSQSRVSALDRALGDLNRLFEKKVAADQGSFRHLSGLVTLSRIIQLVDMANIQAAPPVPQKSLVLACQVFKQACKGSYDNCHYMMFSNKLGILIDFLIHQLTLLLPTDQSSLSLESGDLPVLPYNLLTVSLMQLLTNILTCLAKHSPSTKSSEASLERMSKTIDTFTSRGNDIISYIISVGIVDKITQYLRMVQGPIDNDKEAAEFIQNSIGLLVALTKFLSNRKSNIFEKKKLEDPTQLISTFEVTECVGIVSLLYGMLLHSGTPSRGDTAPPEFPQHTLGVATAGLRMLNHMATLDLDMMQSTVGQEGTSLEFRHMASYLVWYCSHHMAEELLHEVILCVGYFAIHNTDNQVVIQSGQPPTVLQQLCALPFQYFSDPRLVNILFPTLISCCYNNQANRDILMQELSCILLSNFIEDKILESQQQAQMAEKGKKGAEKEKRDNKEPETRMTLATRFPTEQWMAAQEYFKVSYDSSSEL